MAEPRCSGCGAPRSADDSFCPVCDTFFGWQPVPAADPVPVTGDTGPPATVPVTLPRPAPQSVDRARPPVVTSATAEVEVSPQAPGVVAVQVRNGSSIVESYEVGLVDPPPWLVLSHSDARLLPDEARSVVLTLAVAPGTLAPAQRYAATVRVHSGVDRDRAADVPLVVVVPRSGPPATLTASPALLRLQDADRGRIGLRLDNRAANHPRRYALSATDPEGVVRVQFTPAAVDVPAGGTAEATAQVVAPPPPPGQEVTRQLTVVATAEDGPVTTQVGLAQATAAEVERRPLKLRLEPSQVTARDSTHARLDLVVDNRGGHEPVVVRLRGRDPASALGFAFDHDGFPLEPGRAVRLGMTLTAELPPPGQTVTRPFTVVADGSGLEAQVDGTLELTSRPAAVSTAAVRLVPDHLHVSSRSGTFRVEVDNRRGAEPLAVVLHGADEFGRASFRITPPQLTVLPGQVGLATAVVQHPKPEGGSSQTRKVRVTAATGTEALHAEAAFTQEAASHRRTWAYAVALLGILLVTVGAVLGLADLGVETVEATVRRLVDDAQEGSRPAEVVIRLAAVAVALGLVFLALVMMLFGLVGTTGRGLRVGGVLAALAGVAAIIAAEAVSGFGLVIVGAVVAFVGGILVRSAQA